MEEHVDWMYPLQDAELLVAVVADLEVAVVADLEIAVVAEVALEVAVVADLEIAEVAEAVVHLTQQEFAQTRVASLVLRARNGVSELVTT